MAYTKTVWVDDSTPAINANNLNKIEQGIYDNALSSMYSTNEIRVGTWINNKPIYRKVIRFNPNTSSLATAQNHEISNVDEILPTSSCLLHRTTGEFVPFTLCYPLDVQEMLGWTTSWQISKTQIITWIGENMRAQIDTTNYGAVAILEYTKTTD